MKHSICPAIGAYLPTGQLLHCTVPYANLNLPLGHCVHAASSIFVCFGYNPPVQFKSIEPSAFRIPCRHAALPAYGMYFPFGQLVHSKSEVAFENLPDGHFSQNDFLPVWAALPLTEYVLQLLLG